MTASSEAPPEGLAARPLGAADAGSAFPLSVEAGWNQTVEDWRFMLAEGEGIGLAAADGRLVATTLVLPYGPFAWVSMVLVTAAWRQRGLARWLVRWAIARLEARSCLPVLDATPAGREVYRRLGFADGPIMQRFAASSVAPPSSGSARREVRTMTPEDLPRLAPLDRAAFAADRQATLRYLFAAAPDLAFVATAGERVTGFVLGRPGRAMPQLGPLVAENEATACALLGAALAPLAGSPAVIDAFAVHEGVRAALLAAGFAEQRPFTRMALGAMPPGRADLVFAAAGPELG